MMFQSMGLLVFQVCCLIDVLAAELSYGQNADRRQCENLTVDSGQYQVTLPCTFEHMTGGLGTIRWRVDYGEGDKEVLTRHSSGRLDEGGDYKERVEIPNTIIIGSTRNISLMLKRPLMNDTGRYICELITSTGERKEMQVQLRVIETPKSIYRTATQADHTVELSCEDCLQVVDGTITWRKHESGTRDRCILKRYSDGTHDKDCNNRYLYRVSLGSRQALVLSSPNINDTGNYSCTIESQCSRITTYIYLTVKLNAYSTSQRATTARDQATQDTTGHGIQRPTSGSRAEGSKGQKIVETNTGIAIGISCGVVALILVAVLGFLLYRRRRRKGTRSGIEPGDNLEAQAVPLNDVDQDGT